MVPQPIFDTPSIIPSPSSQTTTIWPLVIMEDEELVTSQRVGHDVSSPIIRAFEETTRDKLIEQILTEHAEAWERLAAL